ncbi:MAG: hypothetical protein AAB267_01795, partial [Candidatus Desantisbacteria bacterium]
TSAAGSVEATTTFFILPEIYILHPPSVKVGEEVTVYGRGYSNQGVIRIDFGTHYTITTAIPTASGTFNTTFLVDTQPSENNVITAKDPTGDYDTITFTVSPRITLIYPESGQVGGKVTVEGAGYTSQSTITLSFGTHLSITTTKTSASGTFSITFLVSTQSYSTKVITITSHFSILTSHFFILPYFSISPPSGKIGKIVTILGKGYTSQDTITVHFGTYYTITTTISSGSGTFSTTFITDTQPGGTKAITIATSYSLLTTPFSIIPEITYLSPSSGRTGSGSFQIAIEGCGMNGEGSITVLFGVTNTYTAEKNGTFSFLFTAPNNQPAGWAVITAIETNGTLFATTTFLVFSG